MARLQVVPPSRPTEVETVRAAERIRVSVLRDKGEAKMFLFALGYESVVLGIDEVRSLVRTLDGLAATR